MTDNLSEASDNISDHAELLDEKDNGGIVQLTVSYMNFFRNLWLILKNNDLAKKHSFLKSARSAAAELIA